MERVDLWSDPVSDRIGLVSDRFLARDWTVQGKSFCLVIHLLHLWQLYSEEMQVWQVSIKSFCSTLIQVPFRRSWLTASSSLWHKKRGFNGFSLKSDPGRPPTPAIYCLICAWTDTTFFQTICHIPLIPINLPSKKYFDDSSVGKTARR